MSLNRKSILFIVEGEVGEVRVLEKLTSILYAENEYSIFPVSGSIYELYEDLYLDDDLDLLLHLKSKTDNEDYKEILSRRYNSIYLIFDFDPHYQKYEKAKLIDLLNYFCDSRDKGKLLINYPMFESYRHLKQFPDYDFKNRKISISDIYNYKCIVNKESLHNNINKYNYEFVINILIHHLCKTYLILRNKFKIGKVEDFNNLDKSEYIKILNIQDEMIRKKDEIYVLNTSIFFLIELKPISFFRQVNKFVKF